MFVNSALGEPHPAIVKEMFETHGAEKMLSPYLHLSPSEAQSAAGWVLHGPFSTQKEAWELPSRSVALWSLSHARAHSNSTNCLCILSNTLCPSWSLSSRPSLFLSTGLVTPLFDTSLLRSTSHTRVPLQQSLACLWPCSLWLLLSLPSCGVHMDLLALQILTMRKLGRKK